MRILSLLTGSLVVIFQPVLAAETSSAEGIRKACLAFMEKLEPAQQKKALLPFTSDERENWHFVPMDRQGLALKEMDEAQKSATKEILRQVMSEKGLLKAEQIISLEGVLAKLENNPKKRDMEKYWVAIFGQSNPTKPWAVRFEGHHLSVNLTFAGSDFSVTPSFMGTNPAKVQSGEKKGLRVLFAEEDQARALVTSLLKKHPETIYSDKAPDEILTGQERKYNQLKPVGVHASAMTDEQRRQLMKLLAEYTGRYRPDLAERDLERIKSQGIDKICFGWAGSIKKGEAYYYRDRCGKVFPKCRMHAPA